MHFGITEKLTTDYASLYNNAGLVSKVSEKMASENAEKIAVLDNRTFDAPSPGNPCEYPHIPYAARN